MTRPRVYNTEAIVLKHIKLGEADRIVTLYTPHLGKVRAVAKGARRTKSKLAGHVELLTHSMMMLARGQNLDIIAQSQTIDSFLPLREDLWRISLAVYAAELVERFTVENIKSYPVFKLLLDTLHRLCYARDGELVLRYFELHILEHLGYRPQLQQCVSCNAQLKPTANFFSPDAGGMLCLNCSSGDPTASLASLNALKVMRLLQGNDYATAGRLRMDHELSLELVQLMQRYIRYLLEQEVKSAAWLGKLRREALDNSKPEMSFHGTTPNRTLRR